MNEIALASHAIESLSLKLGNRGWLVENRTEKVVKFNLRSDIYCEVSVEFEISGFGVFA